MGSELVYSSDGGKVKKSKKESSSGFSCEGPTKMRLEKKGRGGKAVTVLFNLPFTKAEAKELKRALQEKLGCGATLKQGSIELQGDVRDRVADHFQAKGLQVKFAGG